MLHQLFFEGVPQLLEMVSLFLVVFPVFLSCLLVPVHFDALSAPLEKLDDGFDHSPIFQSLEGQLLWRLPCFVLYRDIYLVLVDQLLDDLQLTVLHCHMEGCIAEPAGLLMLGQHTSFDLHLVQHLFEQDG